MYPGSESRRRPSRISPDAGEPQPALSRRLSPRLAESRRIPSASPLLNRLPQVSRRRVPVLLTVVLVLAALVAPASGQGQVLPGDPVPEFTLQTTTGEVTIGAVDPMSPEPGAPNYVLAVKSPETAWSASMWSADVAHIFEYSPDDTHWVFASYAATEEERLADIDALRLRIESEMPASDASWDARIHYVTDNPMEADTELAEMLLGWGSVLADVSAEWEGGGISTRGTTDTGWAASLYELGVVEGDVAYYGEACGDQELEQSVDGRIALIARGTCPFTEKAANAERNGAIAAVLFTNDSPITRMLGSGKISIPVVMIERQPGLEILEALRDDAAVSLNMTPVPVGVEAMGITGMARAHEFGTIPFPWGDFGIFRAIAYEAQAMSFGHARALDLANRPADEVPVFEAEMAADPGWAGRRSYVTVELPSRGVMEAYDTLEVDLALSCPENRKGNCPPWDYLVYMYLCDAADPDRCDQEIGRWITPYWSGGRWVTDISWVLAFLHEGGPRRFAFYTQQPYRVDATLRLSNQDKGSAPRVAVPLFQGGAFNLDYNDKYRPYDFGVPEWATRVEIVALITGHGWGDDTENCAEFCNHTHHFTVNGTEHAKTHPEAGTEFGCASQVVDGVVPNQGGTWIYGRGGWCPGLDVPPWIVDITAELDRTAGALNTITYRGLFNGADFDPQPLPDDQRSNFPARIDMASYLVYWADHDAHPTRTDLPSRIALPWLVNGFELP